MTQYIDKSAVVAEIESLRCTTFTNFDEGVNAAVQTILEMLDTLEVKEVQEEPVSNDLEAEFVLYLKHKFNIPLEWDTLKTDGWSPSPYDLLDIAKHFAQWQKEQMEKNRIAHCDNITEEQYNLETGFLDDFLDKNNMMPTFLDAIEYGMQKQITKACEWLRENKDHPLIGCEDPCLSGYLTDEFIEEFKKAVEE